MPVAPPLFSRFGRALAGVPVLLSRAGRDILLDRVATDQGVWRTINGARVCIKGGIVVKGPKHLIGLTHGAVAEHAAKGKFVGATVGKDEHTHAAKLEKEIARHVGGKWLEDNEAVDVEAKSHALEVKSLLTGKKQAVTMHDDALARKIDYAAAHPGHTIHTVAVDDRATYGGGKAKGDFSGNRIYYKRGAGRYSLSKMHAVKSGAELKRLVAMRDDELPEAARGSVPSDPAEVAKIRANAERDHAARVVKDRVRKQRLSAAKKAAKR